MNADSGRLEIDPGVPRKAEPQLGFALQNALTGGPPDLREERCERGFRGVRRAARPEDVYELGTGDHPRPVRREVGEEQSALPSGECLLDALSGHLGDEAPAKLDPRAAARQGSSKVTASGGSDNAGVHEEGAVMGKVVNCECGEVVRADSDGELVASVEAHVARNHPDLVGKLSREDILGMAEEE